MFMSMRRTASEGRAALMPVAVTFGGVVRAGSMTKHQVADHPARIRLLADMFLGGFGERTVDENDKDSSALPLLLVSKRGVRLEALRKCDECRVHASVTWRYGSRNHGTVYLCSTCKPLVFDRSHGSADALK